MAPGPAAGSTTSDCRAASAGFSGLGYLVLNTRDALAYSDLMGVTLVIGMCRFILDALARFAQRVWQKA